MNWRLPAAVEITEEATREGFQSESKILPTARKLALIAALCAAGVRRIEVASFAHPKWAPQVADAAEVLAGLPPRPTVSYEATVPNPHGLRRAIAVGRGILREVSTSVAATDEMSLANWNKPRAEAMAELPAMIAEAHAAGMRFRAGVTVAFGCPYAGRVPGERVVAMAEEMVAMGADAIWFGDTTGMANPRQVHRLFERARAALPAVSLIGHFHNSRGAALANVLAALVAGVAAFDSSAGELGGTPYAKGASGNVATEDLVAMLHGMGIATGIDPAGVVAAARQLRDAFEHPLASHMIEVLASD